jgi:hypothetical protein
MDERIHFILNEKCHFQCAFDDNLRVTHIFIKQIYRAPVPKDFRVEDHSRING